jgi:uncharacterized protein
MKRIFAALIVMISATAWAGDFEEGQAAFDKKDYATAIQKFTVSAEQGSARAQFWLGYMYDEGLGVAQDFAKAMRFYRMAADQGSDLAQLHIGYMYEKGRGVAQNGTEALRWSRLAAEQGLNIIQSNVASSVTSTLSLTQDQLQEKEQGYKDAVLLYKIAAELDDARAQAKLGLMYLLGRGVEKDEIEAIRWYKLAAKKGLASAQLDLGMNYQLGIGVSQDHMEAVRWYKLAAEQSEAGAQALLGANYALGRGVPLDLVRGYMWSDLAAAQGQKLAGEVRDTITKEMTPQEIAKAQKLARECLERHYKGCD